MNLTIITSVINISKEPLSYSGTRSIYSPEERFNQTIKTIESLMAATYEELMLVDEIGERIALSINEFFAEEKNITLIQRLKEAGLQLENMEVEKEKLSDVFSGKNIVISGVFTRFSRDEIKELVESHGGKNAGSISTKTSYVVAGENMGPAKLEKARQLNIPILDVQEV